VPTGRLGRGERVDDLLAVLVAIGVREIAIELCARARGRVAIALRDFRACAQFERARLKILGQAFDRRREQRLGLCDVAVRKRDLGVEEIETNRIGTVQPAAFDVAERARGAVEIAGIAQRFGRAQPIMRCRIATARFGERLECGRGLVEIAVTIELLGFRGVGRRRGGLFFLDRRAGCERERE
jgi:hypothetical protein